MKPNSILRQLFFSFIAFGLIMGLVFPLFAQMFVHWKEGMFIWFAVSCLVAGLVIGLLNYSIMKKVLLSKLHVLADSSTEIGKKNLTHRVELHSNDFLGDIAGSFNEMTESLSDSIKQVGSLSRQVSSTSAELLDESKRAFQLVERQHHDIGRLIQASEAVNAASQCIVSQAGQAADIGSQTREMSRSSLDDFSGSREQIRELGDNIESARTIISKLDSDCSAIGSMLDVIKSIAEQTNLLALNAAIEAARAGEAGRGFAVVADEVRTLATRTQQSTAEIERIIAQLQASSGEAVSITEKTRQLSSNAQDKTQQAASSMEQVQTAIGEIVELIAEISHSLSTQHNDIEEINTAVSGVRDQASLLYKSSQNNESSSHALSGMAADMTAMVSSFTVGK